MADRSPTSRVLRSAAERPAFCLRAHSTTHSSTSATSLDFGSDVISTDFGGTSLELGGGLVAAISKDVSLYATADYTFEVEGEKQQVMEGNVGLKVQW